MAAFTKIFLDARRYSYTGLSTDTRPTSDVDVGVFAFETDTGDVYQYNGVSWDQKSTGGAGHVLLKEPGDIFIGGMRLDAQTSGRLVQLWNPSDSGINATVISVAGDAVSGNLDVWRAIAALTTPIAYGAAGFFGNVDFGNQGQGGIEMYQDQDVTETGTRLLQIGIASASNDHQFWELTGIIITPGTGMTLRQSGTANHSLRFKWSETAE